MVFNIFRDPLIKNLRKIWDNYDQDHSSIMEFQEFKLFIAELNLKLEGLSDKDFFNKIDVDNSGKIDFLEFVKYYRALTSGKEFQPIFEQYSSSKSYLTIHEFKRFMLEVQKTRDFHLFDAIHLFNEFCEKIPKEVKQFISKIMQERDTLSKEDSE